MQFRLLTGDDALQHAQDVFPLLYNDCRPHVRFEEGVRHGVAADAAGTFLLVFEQALPATTSPVVVKALVVQQPSALPVLSRFLAEFTRIGQGYMSQLCIGGAWGTVIHTAGGVTVSDIHRTLQGHQFRPDGA